MPFAATRAAIAQLQGAYALAVMRENDPSRIIVAREGSPLLLGLAAAYVVWTDVVAGTPQLNGVRIVAGK